MRQDNPARARVGKGTNRADASANPTVISDDARATHPIVERDVQVTAHDDDAPARLEVSDRSHQLEAAAT